MVACWTVLDEVRHRKYFPGQVGKAFFLGKKEKGKNPVHEEGRKALAEAEGGGG